LGVLSDERTGLSVTSCLVFVRCHYSEDTAVYNINTYKTPCDFRSCIVDYAASVLFYFIDSLVACTVVSLTASKFKPVALPVHGFTLSYIEKICILLILDDFYLYNTDTRTEYWKPHAVGGSVCLSESHQWCGEPSVSGADISEVGVYLELPGGIGISHY
jgi:hypothetical protein